MHARTVSLLVVLVASSLSAANLFFDPPDPTSATPVTAIVRGVGCPPLRATFQRNGTIIGISLDTPQCLVAQPFETRVSLGVVPAGVYDVVASPNQLLVAIAEGFLVVRNADPAFTVIPNVVPTSGGSITLRARPGSTLAECVLVGPTMICDIIAVKIGGVAATLKSSTPTETVVQAPPHPAGPVDVTIERSTSGTLSATAALDYFEFQKTPDAAFWETVAFPTAVTGPGAFGSQWDTSISLRNENDVPLTVAQHEFEIQTGAQPIDGRPAPHSTMTMQGMHAPAGLVLFVPRQLAPQVFFDEIVRDLSKQSEAFGAEVPVVREKDLYDRPFSILDVPSDARYRVALRALRTDGGATMRLRIYPMSGETAETALVDIPLTMTSPLAPYPQYTAAAILDLVAAFPQLGGKGALRVQIDGGTITRSAWALVSITNNTTQHVTVLAPH